jgi:hypothetical protein
MKLWKLFRVLVLGGSALGVTQCGSGDTTGQNPQNESTGGGVTGTADGGNITPDGGHLGGGGPPGW